MKNILCKLGFHNWKLEDSKITHATEVIERTYQICKRCGIYGKCIKFEKRKINIMAG